jgi:hypothetical protein
MTLAASIADRYRPRRTGRGEMRRTAVAAATLTAVVAVLALGPRSGDPDPRQPGPTAAEIDTAVALAAADVAPRRR